MQVAVDPDRRSRPGAGRESFSPHGGCGIGLPLADVDGDLNGLRFGTPEIVRWGMTAKDMPAVAGFIADVLTGRRAAQSVAPEVAAFRSQFDHLHFVRA